MIKELLKHAILKLEHISKTAQLDAELLLTHVLDKSRSYLYAHAEQNLTAEQIARFDRLVARRMTSEPIAYILGKKEFWSLELLVDSNVLIPRSETELLVELVLQRFAKEHAITLADLGTGSGAIALAIASARSNWQIFATDKNPQALKIAGENARNLAIKNIKFFPGNWYDALPDVAFDVIVSNPPYIAENDPHLLQDIRFEPTEALIAGSDGLSAIKRIIIGASNKLTSKGLLLLEHGFDQGMAVRQIMAQQGYNNIVTHQDLAGHDRATGGCKSPLPLGEG